MFNLEKAIASWKRTLQHHPAFRREDREELEAHVRDYIDRLVAEGLTEEEAWHQAMQRMGDYGSVEREYRKVFWVKLFNPLTFLDNLIWHGIMFKNYLKVAVRSLRKHKGAAFINITGLAIGMACCLVVLLFMHEESNYDTYHTNDDRLYRLSLQVWGLSNPDDRGEVATTSILWGPTMKTDFPEVEEVARFVGLISERNPWQLRAASSDRVFEEVNLLYAEPTAPQLFNWPLVQGDAATALAEPRSIVLTEEMAQKYFGDADPMGQTIVLDPRQRDSNGQIRDIQVDYTVTGVLKNIPRQSHFTFDFLVSFVDLNGIYGGDVLTGAGMDTWYWRGRIAHTYLLMREGADIAAFEAKFPAFLEQYVGDETRSRGYDYALFLQNIGDIYLDGNMGGQIDPVGDARMMYMFAIVALFVLLIACVNFMNFATARSATRAREVGMRKVVGAHRNQLIYQFLGESVFTSVIALVVAIGLAWLTLPIFYGYVGKDFVFDPATSGFLVLMLVVVGLFVGIFSGSYPAFFLSKFKPALVLKGSFAKGSKGRMLRKGLVVFQFAISTFLIIATLTVYNQLNYMRTYDLGFDQERAIVLTPNTARPLRVEYAAFRDELLRHPNIEAVTNSTGLPSMGGGGDVYAERGTPAEDGHSFGEYFGDYNFFEVMGLELIAGRTFDESRPSDGGFENEDLGITEFAVIVNEETVRRFGWGSPENALGKQIIRDPRSQDWMATVVGVMEDFHVESLHEPLSPGGIFLLNGTNGRMAFNYITIKVAPTDVAGSLDVIRETTQRIIPDAEFAYTFLDENFKEQYEEEERLSEVFTYISFLAIFIACLGLFGLAAFTAEQRTKEIGVRKVLGATVGGIIMLLSKDFVKLLVVSFLVAIPVGYFVADLWLQEFAYRISLGVGIFLFASLIALGIALLTVSYQAIRAAIANPVDALRYE